MLRFFFSFLFTFTLTCFPLGAKILETHQIEDMIDYIDFSTLVILGIDHTLIESHQTLGSAQWFNYTVRKYQTQGYQKEDAIDKLLPLYIEIHKQMSVKTPEKVTATLIEHLQQREINLLGMTSRRPELKKLTEQKLHSVFIDMTLSTLFKEDIELLSMYRSLYSNGIVYVASNDRGKILGMLLDKLDFLPKKVVYVDQDRAHLASVSLELEKRRIPFVGLRYGISDEKIKTFDPLIAEVQLHFLDKLLPDRLALQIRRSNAWFKLEGN